uniref:Hepcidin n=1 Tax=Oreochromis aureus TaxID=47969 RepID=A0AAZ1XH89_OREAU
MKTFSVAVAVAIVLTFICVQQSSAVPVTEQQHEEASVDSWKKLYNTIHRPGIKCRFCCGCCTPGICGVCCRF